MVSLRSSAPNAPYRDPPIRGLGVVQATLRIFVALECWGAAASRLVSGEVSDLCRYLVRDHAIPASIAGSLDNSLAWCLILAGFVTLVRPAWPLLLVVALFMVLQPIALLLLGNSFPSRLAAVRDVVQVAAPLALLLVDFWPPAPPFVYSRFQAAMGVLRFGAAATFVGWGLQLLWSAVQHTGPYAQSLASGLARLGLGTLSAEQKLFALGVLGAVYFSLGMGLAVGRFRPYALFAALVGLGGAALPTIAEGTRGYPDTLLHLVDGGAPLALLVCWTLGYRETPMRPVSGHEPRETSRPHH